MRQWLADALRRIADGCERMSYRLYKWSERLDPPPPDWCDLIAGLEREHQESVESARIRREIQVRWEDVGRVQRGNVVRLRK